MSKHKHRYRKSFLSSAGYYILVVVLIVCLAMMVKVNRSKKAERDDYKATLSQQETVEDLGNITITKPTDYHRCTGGCGSQKYRRQYRRRRFRRR